MSTVDQSARSRRVVIAVAVCGLLVSAVPAATVEAPSVTTVLDLPYGEGTGQVGFLPAGALDPSSHPLGPARFQMTEDGSIWVLDTVNARILEFKGGEQVCCISTGIFQRFPDLFGVTRSAVFLAKQGSRNDVPAGFLWRYDRAQQTSRVIDVDLPDGRRFLPMGMVPLGSSGTGLLISGSTYPDDKRSAVVINEEGSIELVAEGGASGSMPAADGSVWRLIPEGEQLEDAAPVVAERWSPSGGRGPLPSRRHCRVGLSSRRSARTRGLPLWASMRATV